jgi:DUF971 family protein
MARPTKIQLDRKRGVLVIPWDDGHESVYPLAGLREACPCVECRGGHENMGAAPDPDVFNMIPLTKAKSYVITQLLPVGNYGLQPIWEDGHDAGLYTWAYLRGLCPCDECRAREE